MFYLAGPLTLPLLDALQLAPLERFVDTQTLRARRAPTHLVAVERPGRTADGRYRNMRGEDVSADVAPIDAAFLEPDGAVTIGIGDGGNEVGMGRVADRVAATVPHGERIASVVATDHLVVAGVSTWGAYALAAAVTQVRGVGVDLLPDADQARAQLDAIVAAGAVDGVTGRAEATIDGRPFAETAAVLAELHRLGAGAA